MKKQKTRKGKKQNKMKVAIMSAKIGLRNLAVWHQENNNNEKYTAEVVNFMKCRDTHVGESMISAILKIRHMWNVHLIVIGVESNGKSRIEVEEKAITEPLYQHQIVDYLNEEHELLRQEFAKYNTVTNLAWLAVPNGDSIPTDKIDEIITYKRAWV